jgi:peptidoglycan hydrolase CwlO-like protein
MKEHICCEEIITAKGEIKTMNEKIRSLETLYTPVSRLNVMFVICIFVLSGCLTLTAYAVKSISKTDVSLAEIKKDLGYLTSEIKSLKKQTSYTQKIIRNEK